MFNLLKKSDAQIQQDVMNELVWDASIDETNVTATAKDGVVTLSGTVPHYSSKAAAVGIVRRIGGVSAIADELDIDLLGTHMREDSEIATAAINALNWTYGVPGNLEVSVDNGWITLGGETEWGFERETASKAVGNLRGVRGVTNRITLKSKLVPGDVQHRIEEAFKRSAVDEGKRIRVTVSGNQVTLSGKVHSRFEANDAVLAAWNAPGVLFVHNELTVADVRDNTSTESGVPR